MKKQALHRQYNFPDADLYIQCLERIRYAHRDIKYFDQYGFSLDRLKGFKNQCDKFRGGCKPSFNRLEDSTHSIFFFTIPQKNQTDLILG